MFLKEVFFPSSIAVIGASSDDRKEKIGWTGRLQEFGYRGNLYPINPRASQVLGYHAYPTIREIDEQVDYAMSHLRCRAFSEKGRR